MRSFRCDGHRAYIKPDRGPDWHAVLDQSCVCAEAILFPTALLLCFVGVSLSSSGLFGVVIMLIFAVLGVVMNAFGFSNVIFMIALFLGPHLKEALSQTLALLNADPNAVFD